MKMTHAIAAATIFTGSFLLFLIQPMIGNFLLPHFGGTSAVWVTCLCTFQTLLIVGYAYAHFLSGRIGTTLHVVLLLVAAAVLVPATNACVGIAGGIGAPMLAIIAFLMMTVAVPYVLVGANASLVQSLVAHDRGGYRLYAISNSGSFFGLLCYPLVIEETLSVGRQLVLYAAGTAVYAVLLAALLVAVGGGAAKRRPSVRLFDSFRDRRSVGWFALSAVSCFLLDAVSAHLCTDIVPLPLLWCGILALYLLTWVLGFTERGAGLGIRAAPVAALLSLAAICHLGTYGDGAYVAELVLGLALLFCGTWFVHAWLYLRRPEVERLTHYYFVIALGGGFGGVLAAFVAPLVFPFVAEYPLALTVLVFAALLAVRSRWTVCGYELRPWQIGAAACAVGALALFRAQIVEGRLVFQCRNFYGTVKVVECPKEMCNIYAADSCMLVRPTERTIPERVPPRAKIRSGACLELPHVMMLVDDPEQTLIEPLWAARDGLRKLYGFSLMQDGGRIDGYAVEGEAAEQAVNALKGLYENCGGLLYAVGDGNHSLATAKACWEALKPKLPEDERITHPARWALCEIVNLHSPALRFEPIHRILFGADMDELAAAFKAEMEKSGIALTPGNDIRFLQNGRETGLSLADQRLLPVAPLQAMLDGYLKEHPGVRIDYVHGERAVREICESAQATGILLGAIDKRALFPSIRKGGVLPRKTFSMGEAHEKRYYMEARKIL